MSKIKKLDFYSLRNDEHFQFDSEFRELVALSNPITLKISAEFNQWEVLFEQEDEVLKQIRKSAMTEEILNADKKRDVTFAGMVEANKAALKHFQPAVKEAARKLKIVFDTYGNVARKSYDEETSAITNLLQDLMGKYNADVQTVGITAWMVELMANNNDFDQLIKGRDDESAERTELILKAVRMQIDAVYRTIVERLDALGVIEPTEDLAEFVRRLNVVIERYNNRLAQRQGVAKAKKEKA